ncbi:Thioesterase/thiol ester dehydrase-isomerase [Phlegmacium glaucopus]|nr:Thioesterase/thiol ester dehydrase-isomerase [Phlegmacium glaucopus]
MSEISDTLNQVEHEQISTSLEVEKIEVNLFRSKSLWLPVHARGVFGGQVISQALISATNCVDSTFALHSLHCYFLASGSSATPIVYSVERLRNGKSYVTRSVKAIQNGNIIFIMVCSFQKPEPWQPDHQWTMPQVPPPEQCEDEEVVYARAIQESKSNPDLMRMFQDRLAERTRSPIAIKRAKMLRNEKGPVRYMFWMKARDIPKYEVHYQKCILAYISDLHFISTAGLIMGLKRGTAQDDLSMTSTLDHTIWYYSNDFNAGDWLLYEVDCPRGGSGRGIVHGRMFTHDGLLVAVTSQEGVVRTNARGPSEAQSKL